MPHLNAQDSVIRFNEGISSTLYRILELWERQGLLAQPFPEAYTKLVPTLKELNKLLSHEQCCHDANVSELYDIMAEIEEVCRTLGRVPDDYLISPGDSVFVTTHIAKPKLLDSLNALKAEILHRRNQAKEALVSIATISQRLDVPAKKINELAEDISPSVFEPIMRERDRLLVLERIHVDLLNVAVSRIYYKWHTLALEPEEKDATDSALATLFLSPPAERVSSPTHPSITPFPHTVPCYHWDTKGLSLAQEAIEILFDKSQVYDGPEAPMAREKMLKDIQRVSQLLGRIDPEQDKRMACASRKKLSHAHAELVSEVEPLLPTLTAERLERLSKLWCRCHVATEYRESFSCRLKEAGTSLDNLEMIINEHTHLQFQVLNAPEIFEKIKRRKVLIDKLREFEAKHVSKDRFKGNSIHLLREEKFRKTEYPQLVELENDLLDLIIKFEHTHQRTFEYEGGKFRLILSKSIERRKGNLEIIGLNDSMSTQSFTNRSPSRTDSIRSASRQSITSQPRSTSVSSLKRAGRRLSAHFPPGQSNLHEKHVLEPLAEKPKKASAPAKTFPPLQETKGHSRKSSSCSDTTLVSPNSPASRSITESPVAAKSPKRIQVPTKGPPPIKSSTVPPKPVSRMKSVPAAPIRTSSRPSPAPTGPTAGISKSNTLDSTRRPATGINKSSTLDAPRKPLKVADAKPPTLPLGRRREPSKA